MIEEPRQILLFGFEGCDGVGKGSAKERILCDLPRIFPDFEVLSFREPGGSELGESCRRELSTGAEFPIPPLQEYFLFFAGRVALWRDIVRQIKKGTSPRNKAIFLDRTFPSTWAYQIIGRQADGFMRELFERSVLELLSFIHLELPELRIHHLIFDAPSEQTQQRRSRRKEGDSGDDIKQFDMFDFQERVARGYLSFPDQIATGRLHPPSMTHTAQIIDASGDKEETYANALRVVSTIITSPD